MVFAVMLDTKPIDPVVRSAPGPDVVVGELPAVDLELKFRSIYWLLLPVLAVAAYFTVLRVGFLSDDFTLLDQGANATSWWDSFGTSTASSFYRPVGQVLTWQLGWQLWGFNPLPFHAISLVLHAAIALLLGFWLAEATQRRVLGWLAGALFAVFPLNVEAVGWIADQWDLWAAMFMLASLWLFTKWWRAEGQRSWFTYALSLSAYLLALLSKESVLALLPVYALSAWLVRPRLSRNGWKKLAVGILPFVGVLAFAVVMRLVATGVFGGYQVGSANPVANYLGSVWDIVVSRYIYLLLAPLNAAATSRGLQEWVALVLGAVWLWALFVFGRSARRWLVIAALWIALTLLPTFNIALSIDPEALQQTRFLYLPSMGYCVAAAALLYCSVAKFQVVSSSISRAVLGFSTALIAVCMTVAWLNLRPWQVASTQVLEINQHLQNLIPTQPRHYEQLWFVQNMPDNYQGAFILRLGMGNLQGFTRNAESRPAIDTIDSNFPIENSIASVDTRSDLRDLYAMRFVYDKKAEKYNVDYLAGISFYHAPPTADEGGLNLKVWDFRGCAVSEVEAWRGEAADTKCTQDKGLEVHANSDESYLVGPNMSIDLKAEQAWYVRIRASVIYPASTVTNTETNQWFWQFEGSDTWESTSGKIMPANRNGKAHVYWTYLTIAEARDVITRLRFDPVNRGEQATVEWIAVDLVR